MHLAFTDVRHDTVSYETSYNLLCKAAYAELKANSQSETTSKHCKIYVACIVVNYSKRHILAYESDFFL